MFTSKELDPETNLYYYGARYYDARLSRWISADKYISNGKYLPSGNNERDSNLPGHGGVFNSLNLDAYCYGGDNPVKFTDPDGNSLKSWFLNLIGWGNKKSAETNERPKDPLQQWDSTINTATNKDMQNFGCFFSVTRNQAERKSNKNMTAGEINDLRSEAQSNKTIEPNTFVNNANKLGTSALEKLGINDKKMVVGGDPLPGEKRTGTILMGKAYDLNDNPYLNKDNTPMYHFTSGDANGVQVYNPASNIKIKDVMIFADVFIRPK